MTDYSVWQCYSAYRVLKETPGSMRFASGTMAVPAWGNIAPNGTHKGATIYVDYSDNDATNTLRKPLIVIEGYDASTVAPALTINFGKINMEALLEEPTPLGYDFNTALDITAGYDLVFVDFKDGADGIAVNSAIVMEVISRVNANKVNDTRNSLNVRRENVVMGLSMGGLCARYALAYMTKNSITTETRLLITHDSPHRGANIPLGFQYLIRMMGEFELFGTNIYDIFPQYDQVLSLLDEADGTADLLAYRATGPTSYAANTFLDATYRPMVTFGTADPQPSYRFIATANGNECATALFSPGATFINAGIGVSAGIAPNLLFFRVPIITYKLGVEAEAYALPASGNTTKIARLYAENRLKLFGFINIVKQLYNQTGYAPGSHLAIDGVPGSYYLMPDDDAVRQIEDLPVFDFDERLGSFPWRQLATGYFGINAYNSGVSFKFTFVPVASALDAAPYNTSVFSEKYVNGVNNAYPSSSETFIAQETVSGEPLLTNSPHLRLSPRNARWLFKEMEEQTNLENCGSTCSTAYAIVGPAEMCGNQKYTIPGLQRGASVTWSISPTSGAASMGITTTNSITLNYVGAGNVTLYAAITSACGGSHNISLPIQVGLATPSFTSATQDYDVVCEWDILEFIVTPFDNSYTYEWTVSSGTIFTGQGTKKIRMYSDGSTSLTVWVRAYRADCGYSNWYNYTYEFSSCYFMRLSPNPAQSTIKVSLDGKSAPATLKNGAKLLAAEERIIKKIKIYNASGKLVREISYSGKMSFAQIDIKDLMPGMYVLEVTDKKNKQISKKFVVAK